jgi:hypothetical protein
MLGTCTEFVTTIREAGPATSAETVRALRETYGPLHVGAFEHFDEEEHESLPLMRHHFNAADLKDVEKKMMKDVPPAGVAWVVWPLAPDAKREWMTDVAGIPAAVQEQDMMLAVRQRDARIVVPMKALGAGATEAPSA